MALNENDVFTIPARRCRRCGGLLTSTQGLRVGYGPCCLRKMKQAEADRRMMKDQISLFPSKEDDNADTTNQG